MPLLKKLGNAALAAVMGICLCSSDQRPNVKKERKQQLASMRLEIEKIIETIDPRMNVGIEIVSLKNKEVLYQRNEHQIFIPGSNLKLFTCAAALGTLSSDFVFKTQIFTDGKVKKGVLVGNLYIKGSGDPELSVHDLEELIQDLKLMNISEIKGNIYADNSSFDGVALGPGWIENEGAGYWNSLVDGLSLNHNCLSLWVRPGSKISAPPFIHTYPKTTYIDIQNLATTTEDLVSLTVHREGNVNLIQVSGGIPKEHRGAYYDITVESPSLYCGHVFRELLVKNGVRFKGLLENKTTPAGCQQLALKRSRPLNLIVHDILKGSDNLAVDCLFKKLGQYCSKKTGSWENGKNAILEYFSNKAQLDTSGIVIVDGSGRSSMNAITPHFMVAFLTWINSQFSLNAEFLASLPTSGNNGTLKGRMADKFMKSRIRAKTGTMEGVSAISGYVTTLNGEILAFSIISNGFTDPPIIKFPAKEYKIKFEDKICTLLANLSL